MSRYSRSRDGNEREICQALEAIPGRNITVQTVVGGGKAYKGSALPNAGTPDLLVGMGGRTRLMEVKNPSTSKIRSLSVGEAYPGGRYNRILMTYGKENFQRLWRSQADWMLGWSGSPVHVITTAEQAAAVLGVCLECGADAVPTTGLCADCQAEEAAVS